jgi:hypothetical protein
MHFPGNLSILQIIRKILQSMSFPESSYRFFPDFAHTPEIARAVSPHSGCHFGSPRTARLRTARFGKSGWMPTGNPIDFTRSARTTLAAARRRQHGTAAARYHPSLRRGLRKMGDPRRAIEGRNGRPLAPLGAIHDCCRRNIMGSLPSRRVCDSRAASDGQLEMNGPP